MKKTFPQHVLQTVGFGIIAGIRSMSAPALISHFLSHKFTYKLSRSPLRFIKSPLVNTGLKVLAASEMVGDKLPVMPDRISPGVLASRGVSGALVGAVIHKTSGDKAIKGAVIGCVAAIAATYLTFYLRKNLANNTHVADPVLGLIEDAVALTGGIGLLRSK